MNWRTVAVNIWHTYPAIGQPRPLASGILHAINPSPKGMVLTKKKSLNNGIIETIVEISMNLYSILAKRSALYCIPKLFILDIYYAFKLFELYIFSITLYVKKLKQNTTDFLSSMLGSF